MIALALVGCGLVGAGEPVHPHRPHHPSSFSSVLERYATFGSEDADPVGDVYGDGADDLLVGKDLYSGPYGDVLAPTARFIDRPFQSAVGGDVDGDGYGDLVLGAGMTQHNWAIAVVHGPVGGTIDSSVAEDQVRGPTGSATTLVGLAPTTDADGDGRDDILAAWTFAGSGFSLFLDVADEPTLADADVTLTAQKMSDVTHVASLADWDGDGEVDVLGRSSAGVYLVTAPLGDGRLEDGTPIGTDGTANTTGSLLDAGDLDGDGYRDLLVTRAPGDEPGAAWAWYGPLDGPRTTADADVTFLPPDDDLLVGTAAVADLDGDGTREVFLGVPGGAWIATGPLAGVVDDGIITVNGYATALANAGDLDGDGADDLLVGQYGTRFDILRVP